MQHEKLLSDLVCDVCEIIDAAFEGSGLSNASLTLLLHMHSPGTNLQHQIK